MLNIFDIPGLITSYGYIGIASIVFLESGIFFPLPGDSLLFTAGILASAKLISLPLVIAVIFFSTFLGSIAGYYIGVYIESLRKYKLFRRFLKEQYLKKARIFFDRYGKITMLISRFVPVVRTFAPIVAGVARMNYRKFLVWNFFGSILWATTVTTLGYFLGKIFPEILDLAHYFIIGVILVSLIPLFLKRK